MSRLELRLLGRFDVVLDGRSITEFESATARALLARLATERGRPLSRLELAATEQAAEIMVWGLNERCTPREMLVGEDEASLAAAFEVLTGAEPICQL